MARRRRTARPGPTSALAKVGGSTLPGGMAIPAGSNVADATDMLAALQSRTAGAINGAVPLDRSQGFWALFGPGSPLYPSPFNLPNPQTGQADPRRWEYPVSWNITNRNRVIDWQTLRDAADKVDIIRLCLETRKNELSEQEWDITLSPRAMARAGAKTASEKAALRDKFADEITRLVDWWETPDRTNGYDWQQWLLMLLEDHLVLDAATIFPRMTYGGELYALEVIDGSTIKPLLNEYGNVPAPPAPAYQQWLYGFPRGEYTAAAVAEIEFDRGGLVYKPRTVRTFTPYGFSVVEQALVSAEMYLGRQGWMRSEYRDGTMPTTWLKTDAQIGTLTPEQYRAWETALNDYLAGDTQARHRNKLLPAGFDPIPTQDAGERYKPEYDEFLLKLLCAHIGVPPEEIGFTQTRGLGGAGHAESQDAINKRKSIRSVNRWLVDLLNAISRTHLRMPMELTFQFLGEESEDEAAADAIGKSRVDGGRMVLNEDRDRLGLPRYDGEWADKPFVMTATGPVWLEEAYEEATAEPEPIPPALAAHAGLPPVPPGHPAAQPDSVPPGTDKPTDQPAKPEPGKPAAAEKDDAVTKAAELVAFGRFLAKRGKLSRPFAFAAVDDQLAGELNELAATDPDAARQRAAELVKATAGDARGRDPVVRPPGPRPDQPPRGPEDRSGFRWADRPPAAR